ncbi:MAG TPA: hypothetical protein VEW42_06085 [Candidatus Eisenbacteria bacterium]|nr:hypothetical protein [Candidatus Eisenbacteria bacterium]
MALKVDGRRLTGMRKPPIVVDFPNEVPPRMELHSLFGGPTSGGFDLVQNLVRQPDGSYVQQGDPESKPIKRGDTFNLGRHTIEGL